MKTWQSFNLGDGVSVKQFQFLGNIIWEHKNFFNLMNIGLEC
jgi:hypothetical protein